MAEMCLMELPGQHFTLWIPLGLLLLSLGPSRVRRSQELSPAPRVSAAAMQHRPKPCPHAWLSPALGVSWLASWCACSSVQSTGKCRQRHQEPCELWWTKRKVG